MRIKYANALMADAVELMPSAERIDGRTIRLVLDDYITAHRAFIASVYIAGARAPSTFLLNLKVVVI